MIEWHDPLTLGRVLALAFVLVMSALGGLVFAKRKMNVWGIWLFGLWAMNQIIFRVYSLACADLELCARLPLEWETFWTVVLSLLTYAFVGGYLLVILLDRNEGGRWTP